VDLFVKQKDIEYIKTPPWKRTSLHGGVFSAIKKCTSESV
jgi:hypothetical protein